VVEMTNYPVYTQHGMVAGGLNYLRPEFQPRGPQALNFLQRFANPVMNNRPGGPIRMNPFTMNGPYNSMGIMTRGPTDCGPIQRMNMMDPRGGWFQNSHTPNIMQSQGMPPHSFAPRMYMGPEPGGPGMGHPMGPGGQHIGGMYNTSNGEMMGGPHQPITNRTGVTVGPGSMGTNCNNQMESSPGRQNHMLPASTSSSMGGGQIQPQPTSGRPLSRSEERGDIFKNSPIMSGVPSPADPNYAQQFHNFQQQLYATNTRSSHMSQGMPGGGGGPQNSQQNFYGGGGPGGGPPMPK